MSTSKRITLALLGTAAAYSLAALVLVVGLPSVNKVTWVLLPYLVLGAAAFVVRESRTCAGIVLMGSLVVVGQAAWTYWPAFLPFLGDKYASGGKFFLVFEALPLLQLAVCGVALLVSVGLWMVLRNWPQR